MLLPEPTLEQVYGQLYSGFRWVSPIITFSFPFMSSGLYTGGGEAPGFTAMLANGKEAARLALLLWDDLIVQDFQEIMPGAGYISSDLEFGMTTSSVEFARTYYPKYGSVWFNPVYNVNAGTNNLVDPAIGQFGFTTYVHEIGHALGLDHAGKYNVTGTWIPLNSHDSTVYSLMSYFGPSSGLGGEGQVAWADWVGSDGITHSPQTPMLDDVYVIQRVYGAETATRVENTTYGFNSNITGALGQIYDFARNPHPVLTIYDSAGVDTLDLSGWSTPSIINIGPGQFSSCNSMTYNIAIAYGCNIENAIGGAGADKIYGNALNNNLVGGAGKDQFYDIEGNDKIYGGEGDDTAFFALKSSDYQVISYQNYLNVQKSNSIVALYEIEYLQFSDGIFPASYFSSNSDMMAPTVSTFSPTDGAAGVAVASNIVLTFSESIARGSGTITLRSGSATGTVVESYDAATSSRMTITGSTLTIDPTANLAANTQYFVVFAPGTVKDAAGNAYAGVSTYDFRTLDTLAPTFSSAATSADGLKVILTYNEALSATTAAKTAFAVKVGSAAATVNSVAVNGSTVELTLATAVVQGQAVTVGYTAPAANAANTNAAVQDTAGNDAATLAATTSVTNNSTVDKTAPTVTSIVYGTNDGALALGEAVALSVALSEKVNVTGTPTLALANGGTASYTGGTGTSTLTFSYTPAAGQTAADLATASSNALTGTIKDLAGNAVTASGFNNVNPSGTLAVDVTAPTVSTFSPTDGAAGVAVASNIVLTFPESIARGSGTITLRSGSATGTVVESYDAATSSRMTISGSTLTIDPTANLSANTQYFVVLAPGTVKDAAGNAYAGVSTYDFRTGSAGNVVAGTAAADTLAGTAGVDIMTGLAGADTLTGAGGIDQMDGGQDGDLYIIAAASEHTSAEIADTGTSGTDEVRFTSTTAATLTLYAGDKGLERAVIGTGTSAAAVTTGTTANSIDAGALGSAIALIGNAGANTLTGGSGNDTLTGNGGADTFKVIAGTDTITDLGNGGVDILNVSAGATANATVTAAWTASAATVNKGVASISTSGLAVNLATVTDTSAGNKGYTVTNTGAATTLTGSALDDMLIGGAGNDTLAGGNGADKLRGGLGGDTLTGGAGGDWFIFDTAPNASTNRDTITDFTSGADKLQFSKAIFTGLSGAALGNLTADAFWSGSTATAARDATDRFVYNTSTGALYYDADGIGGTAAIQVALLGTSTHPTLVFSDLMIVA